MIAPRDGRGRIPTRSREHPGGDVERLDHGLVVGRALPRAVERGAVIDRHAQERQPDGDVDARQPGPPLRRLVVLEAERLDRDVALVVIHGDDDIKLPAAGPGEQGIGGQRPRDVQALRPARPRWPARSAAAPRRRRGHPRRRGGSGRPPRCDPRGWPSPSSVRWASRIVVSTRSRVTRSGTRRSATWVVTWMTFSSSPISSIAKSRVFGQLRPGSPVWPECWTPAAASASLLTGAVTIASIVARLGQRAPRARCTRRRRVRPPR